MIPAATLFDPLAIKAVGADLRAARFDPESVAPDGKTCRFNPWPYPIA